MEMRRLGNTGMRVSALGLGTLTWGRDTLESEAAAQLEAFVEAGGNLVDTSPTYGAVSYTHLTLPTSDLV